MFGLGFPELLIILVIILVIFGAGKLPQVGEALGKGLSKFRGAMEEKPATNEPAKAVTTEGTQQSTAEASEATAKKEESPKS